MIIEIENYPKRVVLSKQRKIKYYTKTSKIPKKFQKDGYVFLRNRLYCNKDKEFVIANPKACGTEKSIPVNGQLIWQGTSHFIRAKIKTQLSERMSPFFTGKKYTGTYPICVSVFYLASKERKDIDNLDLIYRKVILDLLRDNVIPEDTLEFVDEYRCRYIESDQQKMVIRLTPQDVYTTP